MTEEIRQLRDGRWAIIQDGIHELAVADTREELVGREPLPFIAWLKEYSSKSAAFWLASFVLYGVIFWLILPDTMETRRLMMSLGYAQIFLAIVVLIQEGKKIWAKTPPPSQSISPRETPTQRLTLDANGHVQWEKSPRV